MAIHATYNGVAFEIDETSFDTWDALELITDAQDGDLSAAVHFARLVFGREQFARIKSELPDNKATTVIDFIRGAFEAAAARKGENPKN